MAKGPHLGLNGVEVGEVVHGLVGGVLEGRHWQGVEVKELCVRGVSLWEDEVLEGESHKGLCSHPIIANRPAHRCQALTLGFTE